MNSSPFRDQLVNELAAMGYAIDDVRKADTFNPPEGVQAAARRALELIADGHAGDGFTDVGRKRASDLAAGRSVSLDTVKRMHSYFARHAVDKQGKDWDNTEKPSPGKVAWLAWGGDPGKTWADAIVRRQENIEKAYKRKYATRAEAARAAANARWGNRTPKPTVSKDVNWQQLESIKEINAAWNDKYGDLVPGGFEGVSVRFARQAADGLDTMFQQYPDVAAGLSFVGSTSSPLYRPTVQKKFGLSDAETAKLMKSLPFGCFGGTSMKYGYIVFSGDSDNAVEDAFSMNQYSGWVVPTRLDVKAGKYIAVHEFGHAVARHMGKQSAGNENWMTGTQDVLDKGTSGAWKKTTPLVTEVDEFGRKTTGSKNISKALSQYGAADPDEAFAESWAEIHLSDSPRPYAATWVKGFAEGLGVPVPASSIAKAYKRKYATREEAARAAANARWGNRTKTDAPATPTGPKIEPWVDQKTAAAVDKEFNRRWGDRTRMRLTGASAESANGFAEAMNEMMTLYPDTDVYLMGTQTGLTQMMKAGDFPPSMGDYEKGLASRLRTPRMNEGVLGDYMPMLKSIRLNKKYAAKNGQSRVVVKASEVSGHFTPTGAYTDRTAAKRTAIHEFGHALDLQSSSRMSDAQRNLRNDAFDPVYKAAVDSGATSYAGVRRFTAAEVGKYASVDKLELFAETFVEYHLSPTPRQLSVDHVKWKLGTAGLAPAPSTVSGPVTKFVSSKRSAAGRKAAEARWGKNMKKFPKALGRMTPRQRASLMLSADKPTKVKFVGPEGKVEEVVRDDAGNIVTERMSPSTEYKRRLYGSDSWVQTGKGPVLGPKAERKKKKKLQPSRNT